MKGFNVVYKYLYATMAIAGYVCYYNAPTPISSVITRSQTAAVVSLNYYFGLGIWQYTNWKKNVRAPSSISAVASVNARPQRPDSCLFAYSVLHVVRGPRSCGSQALHGLVAGMQYLLWSLIGLATSVNPHMLVPGCWMLPVHHHNGTLTPHPMAIPVSEVFFFVVHQHQTSSHPPLITIPMPVRSSLQRNVLFSVA